jgi:hypothetical protein
MFHQSAILSDLLFELVKREEPAELERLKVLASTQIAR